MAPSTISNPATFRDLRVRRAVTFLSSKFCNSVLSRHPNEIVRVEACSVNPIDTKIRAGIYDDAPGKDFCRGDTLSLTVSRLLQVRPQRLPHHWIRWCWDYSGSWPRLQILQARRRHLMGWSDNPPGQLCRIPARRRIPLRSQTQVARLCPGSDLRLDIWNSLPVSAPSA